MSVESIAEAEARLTLVKAAYDRIIEHAESVSIDGHTYTNHDLDLLQRHIERYSLIVQRLRDRAAGASSPFTVATWRN